ncbi:metalloregulator ArsR/SmtB family transcription factor [Kistimonas scapharcae]|uniref:Metalloregulator ArsR/SmtB family transcription factor n=1 Tax=Kistimonas scapharcae TaxID=1036133 RepID=A0ABP8V5Q1_9GAMM
METTILSMRKNAQKATALLKALANENRLMVLCLLVEGEMNVAEINAQIDLSQSALSQHLAVLRRDGLVATRRASQTIYYRIASPEAGKILETLHGIYCDSRGRSS